jgi:hypothetical protein
MNVEKNETVPADVIWGIIFTAIIIVTAVAVFWGTSSGFGMREVVLLFFLFPAFALGHDGGDGAFFLGIIYTILVILGIVVGHYHYHWWAVIILIVLYFGFLLFEKLKKPKILI